MERSVASVTMAFPPARLIAMPVNHSNMALLEDQIAVITGAGSGIGRETATTFADHGAAVVVADIDVEGGEATVETITDAGGEATFVETDVSDPDDAKAMIETAVDEYGGLDILYNNAAIEGPVAKLEEYDNDAFEQVIDVNLKGVWYGMKYGIEAMLADGGGSIISASSIGGEVASRSTVATVPPKPPSVTSPSTRHSSTPRMASARTPSRQGSFARK